MLQRSACVSECLFDILGFQLRITADDFITTRAGCRQFQKELDADACSLHTWLAAKTVGIRNDAVEHNEIIYQPRLNWLYCGMTSIRSVTVYCSSSSAVPRAYFDAATALGAAIARQNWTLVYGGNFVGLMAAVAQGAREAGGKVIGITPQLMADKGIADKKCDELIVTNDMRDRKALLEERGDAFIALPGGLGTFEEVFEIIVGKQLHYHNKPIVLLNVDDYYRPLLAMVEHGIEQKFIKPAARELYFVAQTVSHAIEHLQTYVPPAPIDKWFTPGAIQSDAE
jgi:uncharacterized protein (TIGR00730 family)